MDECLICSESPCTCNVEQIRPVKRSSVRASRRLPTPPASNDRKPVRKFSTNTDGAPAREDSIDTGVRNEDDEVLLRAINLFAPLLSDAELRRHGVERPHSLPRLDERRRKFRSEVVWSETRYG